MAAGLGFKTFTTGEVLTAADTNGYLMQGVLVFASAAARDAAITSPQEGQCCYLKDTDAVLTYSGAAWVGFDDSNAIQNTIVDAKGDIVAASGSDTPARLAVGNNGETLVADSSATTGLRYSATPSASNPILNSSMQIWQRGTSISATANTQPYTADRWQVQTQVGQACTISQQATNDTTNLPFVQYCARVQRNSGQTGTGALQFFQSMENLNTTAFIGKTITYSFYARAGTNYSAASNAFNAVVYSGTGTDQNIYGAITGAASITSTTVTLTTTWQRFTVTVAVPTTVKQLFFGFNGSLTGTASTNDYYEVTGVQVDIGSVALPFRTYAATLQGELAACQRYYFLTGKENTYSVFGHGIAYSTTQAYVSIIFPVTMRTAPTTLDYSTVAGQGSPGGSTTAATSLTINTANTSTKIASLTITVGSGLWTNAYPATILSNNSTSGYVELSAEL